MKRSLLLLTLLCALAFAPSCPAMIDGRMSDPEWFDGVASKLLVLEYESPFGGPYGKQLAELIGRMALATVRGLDSFAVITLRQEERPLSLTPETIEALARKQHTPVVIWGEFYEQSGRIFVTSHLRHVADTSSNARPMQISWDISRLGILGRTRAYASAPTAQVNFAPVEISRTNLAALESLWKQTVLLRSEPREDAQPSGELKPDKPYYVLGASNGWTQLNVRQGGSGWVRLTDLSQDKQFKEMTGLVLYSQGLLQYLAGSHPTAIASFTGYLGNYAARQDPMNEALARILLGYSYHLDLSTDPLKRMALSMQEFERAAKLLPHSASPINCQALALFNKAVRSKVSAQEMKQLEKRLIRVIQMENDVQAVRNLQVLYHLPGARESFQDGKANFEEIRAQRVTLLNDLEKQFRRE